MIYTRVPAAKFCGIGDHATSDIEEAFTAPVTAASPMDIVPSSSNSSSGSKRALAEVSGDNMTVFMALNQLAHQLRSHIETSDKRHDERDKMVDGLALNVSLVAGCLASLLLAKSPVAFCVYSMAGSKVDMALFFCIPAACFLARLRDEPQTVWASS